MKNAIDARDLMEWFGKSQAYEIARAFNELGEAGLKTKAQCAVVRIIYHSQNGFGHRSWRTLVNMPISDGNEDHQE